MAQIGYCYGSEYHLMRFLGHHKNELDDLIKSETIFKGRIKWLDFPYDNNSLSGDGEYKGISFLKERAKYSSIEKRWKEFWPQTGSPPNWDAIFYCDNKIVLVEAKAHLNEINQTCNASTGSAAIITKAFNETKDYYQIDANNDWLTQYYQLANRLAFVYFIESCGIDAGLLNVYFLNGYKKCKVIKSGNHERIEIVEDKSVEDIYEWHEAIDQQYEHLGIKNSAVENVIDSLFLDCNKKI